MFKKVMLLLFLLIIFVYGLDIYLFKNLKGVQYPINPPHFQLPTFGKLSNPETTVILTGDIMLGRSVMEVSLQKGDPNYPLEKVADILKGSDIVFANLENPIIESCPISDSGLKFCADPKMVSALSNAGVDIVNLANNHANNYGQDGIIQTEKYLSGSGISYVGTGNLLTKNIKGTRFGFLGFNFVDNKPKDLDYQMIKESKKNVDILIVIVHWGLEYSSYASDSQKLIGNKLVSYGADVVVGSHPHVVQNVDYVNGKPVFYSLGNFVFDQPWSEPTKTGLAIKLTFQNGKLINTKKLPVYMKNFAQPQWVN